MSDDPTLPDVPALIERLRNRAHPLIESGSPFIYYRAMFGDQDSAAALRLLAAQAAEIERLRAERDEAWREGAETMRAEFLAGTADVASAKDAIAFAGGKPSWDDACLLYKTMITYLPIPERKP